jgi:hypothetical protein
MHREKTVLLKNLKVIQRPTLKLEVSPIIPKKYSGSLQEMIWAVLLAEAKSMKTRNA